jgi:hypothetical protein
MPRRSAVLSGAVAEDRGSANGYVVFAQPGSVAPALQANMSEVGGPGRRRQGGRQGATLSWMGKARPGGVGSRRGLQGGWSV